MTQSPTPASAFWDQRYRQEAYAYGEAPNAYLAAQREHWQPGMRALVPGDGEGRNGVWLAQQGLAVVTVDQSAIGLAKAQSLARRRHVTITPVPADLTQWTWPVAQFDLVAAIFLHLPPDVRPRLHRAMYDALRPGGWLVIEAFRPEHMAYRQTLGTVGGPPRADMLMTPDMLRDDFVGAQVIELTTAEVELSEGEFHHGRSAVVHGVFRKQG